MLQIHDPGAGRWNAVLGNYECLTVSGVEAFRSVTGEFNVLALVISNRHHVGVVQEDVGRLKRWVCEEARRDKASLAIRFVFELGHAAELAERCIALHEPGKLGVLADM